jgi:hypothetical protein
MKKDIEESRRVGRLVQAKAKQCYLNAFRVIQYVPDYEEAEYVEGVLVLGGDWATEHAWVERDGVVIDPTLPSEELVYFPGLRFKGQRYLADALHIPKPAEFEELPIFNRFGCGGVDSPEFRAALVTAYRFAKCEETARMYERYGSQATPELYTSPC